MPGDDQGRFGEDARPWPVTAALAAGAAACFGASFPLSESFVAGWPLAFVWPGLLALAAARAKSATVLALATAVPFLAVFLAHQWWMREVTELGMPVLALYLTGWFVALALALRAALRAVPAAVAVPTLLVASEYLRGDLVCSGYAWFFAAHPLVEWPAVAQVAALGGGWLLSAVAGLVGGALADAALRRDRGRVVGPVAAAVVVALSAGYGSVRLGHEPEAPRAEILAVQTNLPMSNKLSWEPEAQIDDFIGFAALTIAEAKAARAGGRRVDLAVWPETMVPGVGLEPDSIETLVEGRYFPGDRFEEGLRDLSRRIGAPLVVGSPAYLGLEVVDNRFEWSRQFNSAYLVDHAGPRGRTDKIYLTPFGETMPVISRWDWLEAQLLALGAGGMTFDLDEAERPAAFAIEPEGGGAPYRVAVPICFEITMPWVARAIVFPGGERAAGIALNLSNDGWFGGSFAGRRQHLQVSQLRAIELATPVVRAVNTGISASIDAHGRIVASLPAGTAGGLLASVAPAAGVPTSVLLGDGVAIAALAASVVLLLRVWRTASDRDADPGGGQRASAG